MYLSPAMYYERIWPLKDKLTFYMSCDDTTQEFLSQTPMYNDEEALLAADTERAIELSLLYEDTTTTTTTSTTKVISDEEEKAHTTSVPDPMRPIGPTVTAPDGIRKTVNMLVVLSKALEDMDKEMALSGVPLQRQSMAYRNAYCLLERQIREGKDIVFSFYDKAVQCK